MREREDPSKVWWFHESAGARRNVVWAGEQTCGFVGKVAMVDFKLYSARSVLSLKTVGWDVSKVMKVCTGR